MLSRISIGWHWLERTLNEIIDAVNADKIIPSQTIAVNESPNGTMLSVTSDGGSGGGTDSAAGGSWILVTVVNPTTCAQSQLQVWAKPP
jgi:hypothetical protein